MKGRRKRHELDNEVSAAGHLKEQLIFTLRQNRWIMLVAYNELWSKAHHSVLGVKPTCSFHFGDLACD